MSTRIQQLEDAVDARRSERQLPGQPASNLLPAAARWSEAVWRDAEEAGPFPIEEKERQQGLALARQPVFICGVHRSGTTLMRDLLDGHSALSVLPSEGSFLTELESKLSRLPAANRLRFFGQEWLRRLCNVNFRSPKWLLGKTTADSSPYVQFARRLMAWWRISQRSVAAQHTLWPMMALALAYSQESRPQGAGFPLLRWVEKTPTNEFHLTRLGSEFPAAKFIHVVRNPVAVYASRKRIDQRNSGSFLSARRTLQDLAKSMHIATEQSRRLGYLVIQYEQLLARPQFTMEGLARFLEIDSESSLLRPTIANISVAPNSSFRTNQEPGRILPENTNHQENGLTSKEEELIVAYTGRYANRLGYSLPRLTASRKGIRLGQFHLGRLFDLVRFRGESGVLRRLASKRRQAVSNFGNPS